MIVQQEESTRVEYAPGPGADIGKPRIFSVRDTYLAAAEQVIERVIAERDDALTCLRIEKECRAGNKYAVVDTVGGWVEGQPTTEFNYLQRLRELVGIELELKTVYAKLEAAKQCEVEASLDAINMRSTLERISRKFVALHKDSNQNDSVGEIYHLLRECGALKE
jgi:hypothetical protein